MPKAECIQHRRKPFFATDLEKLRILEFKHYRESDGKGPGGFHLCTVFEIFDDDGKLIILDEYAHGGVLSTPYTSSF
jgi:hypothetical protein